MTALGKALAAGTLAFGAAALFSGTAGASSPYSNDWNNDWRGNDDHAKYSSYDRDSYDKQDFYRLSYDDQQRLCEDDNYWSGWNWYYGDNDRDSMCNDFWMHDGKNHGDWNKYHDNGWNGDRHEDSYNKNENYDASYSAKNYEHEKTAYAVEASQSDSDNYGHDNDYSDGGWGWNNGNDSSYGYNNNDSSYKAEGYNEKTSESSVQADVQQDVAVNNYNYVNGDNNVINNNITVANSASLDQKASSSEVNYASVAYNDSSDRGYGSEHNNDGWGDRDHSSDYGNSSSDSSYKATAYSEKESYSEVKQDTNYNLDESYRSSDDYGHGYGHDGYRNYDDDDCDD